jgi:hypothetical protein
MLRVATVVQRIMTKVNDVESEDKKVVAITKIIIKLTNLNLH